MTKPGDLKCYMSSSDKIVWFVVAIDETYVYVYLMRIMINWNIHRLAAYGHQQYDGMIRGWEVQVLRCK